MVTTKTHIIVLIGLLSFALLLPIHVQAEAKVTFNKEEAQLLNQLNDKDKALTEFTAAYNLLPLVQLFTSNPLDVASQLLIQEGVQYIYGPGEYASFENSLVKIASAHCTSQANWITFYFVSKKISKDNKAFFEELRDKYEACGKR